MESSTIAYEQTEIEDKGTQRDPTIKCASLGSKEDPNVLKKKRNEYYRQQMKKYRLKIKADPARYSTYLKHERERNVKKKERKVLELMNRRKTMEETKTIFNQTNENRLKRVVLKKNNDKSHSRYDDIDEENVSPNTEKNDSVYSEMYRTLEIEPYNCNTSVDLSFQKEPTINYTNKLESKEGPNPNRNAYFRQQMKKYRLKIKSDPDRYSAYLKSERERNRKRKQQKLSELVNSGKTLAEAKKIFNQRKTKSSTKVVLEKNNEDSSNILMQIDNITEETNNSAETLHVATPTVIKINEETDKWCCYSKILSNNSNDIEEGIKYNRICGVITCPTRINHNLALYYYPIPTEKNMRDVWFTIIKSKTKQSEIDSDSLICSLHFAPEWFQKDEICNKTKLLLNAVPTIFPESQIYSQFDTKIPEILEEDLNNSKFAMYYKWSVAKIRLYESQLKEQLLTNENLNELIEIQKKRIQRNNSIL